MKFTSNRQRRFLKVLEKLIQIDWKLPYHASVCVSFHAFCFHALCFQAVLTSSISRFPYLFISRCVFTLSTHLLHILLSVYFQTHSLFSRSDSFHAMYSPPPYPVSHSASASASRPPSSRPARRPRRFSYRTGISASLRHAFRIYGNNQCKSCCLEFLSNDFCRKDIQWRIQDFPEGTTRGMR